MTLTFLQTVYLPLLIWGSYGMGRRLLGRMRLSSPLEDFIASTGIGLGFYSYAVLLFGLVGILQRWLLTLFFFMSLIFAAKPSVSFLNYFASRRKNVSSDWFNRVCFFLFGLAALVLFLLCFNPELETDAVMYHIATPLAWLQEGAIRPIPYNMHSQFHFLIQMQNLLLLALPGATFTLCKFLEWYYAILLAMGGYVFGKRFIGRRAAAAILCSSFMAFELATVVRGSLIDAGVGFYISLGIYFLTRAIGSGLMSHILLSGIFFGLGFGSKNTGILFFVTACLGYLLLPLVDRRARREAHWRKLLIAGAFMLVVTLPWFIKNAFVTGNPFYPFLSGVFPPRVEFRAVAEGFSNYYMGFRGLKIPLGILENLVHNIPLFIHNVSYIGANVMAVWMSLGVLLLALKFRLLSPVERFFILAGLFSLPLILLTPFARFVIGLYPLSAIIFWAGARRVFAWRSLLTAMLGVFVLGYGWAFIRHNVWTEDAGWAVRFLPGEGRKTKGILKYLSYYYEQPYQNVTGYLRGHLSHDDKVLILVNNRLLISCPVPFLPNPHMHADDMLTLLLRERGEDGTLASLDRWGITHVIAGEEMPAGTAGFLKRHFRHIFMGPDMVLYVRAKGGGAS